MITMCLLVAFGFLGYIPFFAKHEYLFSSLGELSFLLPVAIGAGQLKNKRALLGGGFSPSLVPIFVLLPICMQTFVLTMTLPLHTALYELFGDVQAEVKNARSLAELFAQVISICVLPAVIEELLCRGVIAEMMKPYGTVAVMLVSSVAFAMLHFSVYSLPVIFMMGILLISVKILTGSLWACMLMHFSNNLCSLAIGWIPEENVVLKGAVTFFAFVLFPVLVMRLLKKTHPEHITDKGTAKITFSLAMCVCIAIFALITILGL